MPEFCSRSLKLHRCCVDVVRSVCLPELSVESPVVRMRDIQPSGVKLLSRDESRLQKVEPVRSGWKTGRQQQSRETNI